jgi:hypothetical protein
MLLLRIVCKQRLILPTESVQLNPTVLRRKNTDDDAGQGGVRVCVSHLLLMGMFLCQLLQCWLLMLEPIYHMLYVLYMICINV